MNQMKNCDEEINDKRVVEKLLINYWLAFKDYRRNKRFV
jgi:hypothetical protein